MARRKRKARPAHRRAHSARPRSDGSQRHLPLHRACLASGRGEPTRRDLDPALARLSPCSLCGREARGFGFVHELQLDRYPHYRFCSMRCLDAGSTLAMRNFGMIDKTKLEVLAIKDARRVFAEVLAELGLMEPFFH